VILHNLKVIFEGKTAVNIFEPSRGGSGRKLNTASDIFITKP